jgi:hypothetical protein
MNKIINHTNLRTFRIFLILLPLLTNNLSVAQSTLCERLAQLQISSSTIDLSSSTSVVPNWPVSTSSFTKRAYQRLVLVANVVTVTSSVVIFEDCDIRMAEGAGFIVPAGKNLIFKHCNIAAFDCDKLWNTLKVNGGTLYLTDNCVVEDARTVITCESA